MDAVQVVEPGDRGVVQYDLSPDPQVGTDDVHVDENDGARNPLDGWSRRGSPAIDLERPHVPGHDAEVGVYE